MGLSRYLRITLRPNTFSPKYSDGRALGASTFTALWFKAASTILNLNNITLQFGLDLYVPFVLREMNFSVFFIFISRCKYTVFAGKQQFCDAFLRFCPRF